MAVAPQIIIKDTIDEVMYAKFNEPIKELGFTLKLNSLWDCIMAGLSANKLSTKITENPALMASIAVEKPYNNTTRFLFDLNHEKNRLASRAIKLIAKMELIEVATVNKREL
jgi:hypothetical protein